MAALSWPNAIVLLCLILSPVENPLFSTEVTHWYRVLLLLTFISLTFLRPTCVGIFSAEHVTFPGISCHPCPSTAHRSYPLREKNYRNQSGGRKSKPVKWYGPRGPCPCFFKIDSYWRQSCPNQPLSLPLRSQSLSLAPSPANMRLTMIATFHWFPEPTSSARSMPSAAR